MLAREMAIREETPEDATAIGDVVVAAFGRHQEARLIDRLRAHGAVLLSLVAAVGDRLVGHVLYSPVRLGSLQGAGLGPMAVRPELQRQGVGSKLIAEGTKRLRDRGCPFIVVLGHPRYYPRFGFVPAGRHGVCCQWDVPDGAFMLLPLDASRLGSMSGVATYRDEFDTM